MELVVSFEPGFILKLWTRHLKTQEHSVNVAKSFDLPRDIGDTHRAVSLDVEGICVFLELSLQEDRWDTMDHKQRHKALLFRQLIETRVSSQLNFSQGSVKCIYQISSDYSWTLYCEPAQRNIPVSAEN